MIEHTSHVLLPNGPVLVCLLVTGRTPDVPQNSPSLIINMSSSKQCLRSALQTPASTLPIEVAKSLELFGPRSSRSSTGAVKIIAPGPKLPGLTTPQLKLLRKKQRRLEADASYTFDSLRNETHLTNALKATLIFAQYEAGTAVCIDAKGSVLTCSHCFGENEKEWMDGQQTQVATFLYRSCRASRVPGLGSQARPRAVPDHCSRDQQLQRRRVPHLSIRAFIITSSGNDDIYCLFWSAGKRRSGIDLCSAHKL